LVTTARAVRPRRVTAREDAGVHLRQRQASQRLPTIPRRTFLGAARRAPDMVNSGWQDQRVAYPAWRTAERPPKPHLAGTRLSARLGPVSAAPSSGESTDSFQK
jgi:hypothetical protein